jgi:predicted RNA methylase
VETPSGLAHEMAAEVARRRSSDEAVLLDPCVGSGTFPRALLSTGALRTGDRLTTIDVDADLVSRAAKWVPPRGVTYVGVVADYLTSRLEDQPDFTILNPPFVRHQLIRRKEAYARFLREEFGVAMPGASNLYAYFLVKAALELGSGGILVAVVDTSWNFARYASVVRETVERNVHLERCTHVQRPFGRVFVDATVLVAKRRCRGRAVSKRRKAQRTVGFASAKEVFRVRRGLSLKQADIFVVADGDRIPGSTRFVRRVTRIPGYRVPSRHPERVLLVTGVPPV